MSRPTPAAPAARAAGGRRNPHRRCAGEPRGGARARSGRSRRRPARCRCPASRSPISSRLAAREAVTLRALLEELRAAGLELVAEAPFDLLQSARRSIEEVNIAGLALARLTVHRLPGSDVIRSSKSVAELQREVGVIRAFAPLPRT